MKSQRDYRKAKAKEQKQIEKIVNMGEKQFLKWLQKSENEMRKISKEHGIKYKTPSPKGN